MAHKTNLDYIGWLASLLMDPRRGRGFTCTEFQRRLPHKGFAIGIADKGTVLFTLSGTPFNVDTLNDIFHAGANNMADAPTCMRVEGGLLCTVPFPLELRTAGGPSAVFLIGAPENEKALSENQAIVEAVIQKAVKLANGGDTPTDTQGEATPETDDTVEKGDTGEDESSND